VKDILPYKTHDAWCPKCGKGWCRDHVVYRKAVPGSNSPGTVEHLAVTCGRCKYTWLEHTREYNGDKQGKKTPQEEIEDAGARKGVWREGTQCCKKTSA
jgi:ribosomal protein S27AE